LFKYVLNNQHFLACL